MGASRTLQSLARLPDGSLSRKPLWRVSHSPLDQESTTRRGHCPWRWICQYRASTSVGPPCIRLCRLHHPRRRGTAAAFVDRTSGGNQSTHTTLPNVLSG